MYNTLAIFSIVIVLSVNILAEENSTTTAYLPDRSEYKRALSRDCTKGYSSTCFKLDLVSWVDRINDQDEFNMWSGVSLVREKRDGQASTPEIISELARQFPNDPEDRIDALLLNRVNTFFSNRALKLNIFDNSDDENVEMARQKKKKGGKKGGHGILLAMAAMLKATLMAKALGIIAAIAGKALMAGMISLVLSAIIGLKSLHGHKETTYEIIPKPVYSHSTSHSHSHEENGRNLGFERNIAELPLPLALQPGYKPK